MNRELPGGGSAPSPAHADTEAQIQRLDGVLLELGTSPSMMRDLATEMPGNMAALARTVLSDAVMKNDFANVAFEAFEQATYRSLSAMAEAMEFRRHVPTYEASLREEEKTFATFLGKTDQLMA